MLGGNLRSCLYAVSFFCGYPFVRTIKPSVGMTDFALQDLSNRLYAVWRPLVEECSTWEDSFNRPVLVEISFIELEMLVAVFDAVLGEIGHSPTEVMVILEDHLDRIRVFKELLSQLSGKSHT